MCLAASVGVGWVLFGPIYAVAGLPVGLALSVWIGRMEPPSVARAREEVSRDLPLAVDLMAACAVVGRPPEQSLQVVSTAVGGALAARLDGMSARLLLGADPATEWA
ncbi:MAG: type II secretion system F family protein, partial [Nocardioidaceae bacterium]